MKICITGFEPDGCNNNRSLYAKYHGYEYQQIKNKNDFNKLCGSSLYDWIHWLNKGGQFMNFSCNLEDLIDKHPEATCLHTKGKEQILQKTCCQKNIFVCCLQRRSALSFEHGDFVTHTKRIGCVWSNPFFEYQWLNWKACSDLLSLVIFVALSWSGINLLVLFIFVIIFDLFLRFLPIFVQ